MLSLEKCKKHLDKGKRKYTTKEVEAIREILYELAKIQYNEFPKKRKDGYNLH